MVHRIKPKKPTSNLVRKYLRKHRENPQYMDSDKALHQLIQQNPTNEKITDIILKANVINAIESTKIFGIYQVAKHIKNKNIDTCLKKGSPDLVDDIARITIGDSPKRLFSFASKYCHHHNQEAFPKCDSYVCRMLTKYKSAFGFNDFHKVWSYELNDYTRFRYSRFKDILIKFREYFDLTEFNLREIDIFLWMYGKYCLPPKYKKKK